MLKQLSPTYIADRLAGAVGESRNLEFKAGFSWELKSEKISWVQARTIKAILGMTNTRYGGTVIIGIGDDGQSKFAYDGVSDDMITSFENYEQIQQQLDSFADGPLVYEVGTGAYNSKNFVVITVSEFEEFPVLCAKDCKINDKIQLVKHDLYVRSKRAKPATIKATNVELREIVQMAHTKSRTATMELVGALRETLVTAPQRSSDHYEPYEQLDGDL